MEAKISLILLANSNQAALDRCVASCLGQVYSEFELLVLTNGTVKVTQADERIKVYDAQLTDLGAVRLAALKSASADYIMFLEADDFLVGADALMRFMERLNEYQSDLVITNDVFYKDGVFGYPSTEAQTKPITVNNYLSYARRQDAFRRLGGNIIAKDLLLKLGEQIQDLTIQAFYMKLCLKAKRALYISDACYAYNKEKHRQIPPFIWQASYHVGPAATLVKQIQASTYQAKVPKQLAIAICLDEESANKVEVLLYSIERNTPSGGVIYLIYKELTPMVKEWLVRLGQGFVNFKLKFVELSPLDWHLLSKISLAGNHLPVSAYYRILLPNLLPEVDRVLYLDYDTLVVNDLASLWQRDLEGNFLGCVRDLGIVVKNSWGKDLFGKYKADYFNSGVLLMDLHLLRKYSLITYFYQFILETTDFFVLGDQDAYNLFFKDAVKYLDIENNYVIQLFASQLESEHRKLSDIRILHFLGVMKPWNRTENYPLATWPAVATYCKYRQELRSKYKLLTECAGLTVLVLVTDTTKLARCLDSIYHQNYPNLEVMLIDVSSNQQAVLEKMAKYEERGKWIRYYQADSTLGLGALIQIAVKQAQGSLITFISSQAFFNEKEPLKKMLAYLKQEQLDLVGAMHMVYHVNRGMFEGFATNGKFEDVSSRSTTQLLTEYTGEYQQLGGIVFRRELLAGSEEIVDEFDLVKHLLTASQKRATWKEYAWVLED